MNDKMIDYMACVLTSLGMAQTQDTVLFWLSLLSTIFGLALTVTRNIIIPLIQKSKNKQLSLKDIPETLDKVKNLCDDIVDDGQLNGSNKSKE